ncbi:ferrous iron transport protein A [Microbispora sp. RL4-1S]|uniref:Ferrous iron transport protein A n=1 Tax=Microbispora oryzae TaxID=2806554 RepID=A0A940WRI9_9ACTN|nr:FeoA family protein [Microbispora oryzae]MBP2706155.1 ferrous iron transport protein A [Microbispora oryzae]
MSPGDFARGGVMRLSRVTGDRRHRRRLAELGFVPGAKMSVLNRGLHGGLVLVLGDGRVAVDALTAATLVVEPADG